MAGLMGLAIAAPAVAAQKVVMRYGPIARSLPVKDLSDLVDTGRVSPQLYSYLRLADQKPEGLRQQLTRPLNVNLVTLDRQLNSVPGNLLLDEAGRYIHPPGSQASRQALRGALILSASGDNQITLIEILENYPTQDVEVDVEKTIATYQQIDGVLNQRIDGGALDQQLDKQLDKPLDGGGILNQRINTNSIFQLIERKIRPFFE